MVRLFVPGEPGTFLVGCVGADLAVLQALLLIAAPSSRKCTLLYTPTGLPAHALVFSWCQPSHLSLQHFPLVRVLWAQCWRHDSAFGTWGTQTSSSFASFYKCFWMQRNVSSLESTSATNEQVFRVCLEQDPRVLVLFLYFPTSSTFAPCERWVIGLKTFGVFQCSWS